MATPKYKKQIEIMLTENKALFEEYSKLQDAYDSNHKKYKDELTDVKNRLLRVIRRNEDRLCARTENTHYSAYSENLALKFWEEIRIIYPKIDGVVD
jgi:hypothetical protein